MIIFDDAREENIKEHNLNWPQIPANYFSILIIGDSGSEKNKCITSFNKLSTGMLIKFIYTLKIHLKQNINS